VFLRFGSGLDLDFIGSVDLDRKSGSRKAKIIHKKGYERRNFKLAVPDFLFGGLEACPVAGKPFLDV